jgi:hypothetical protein
MSQQQGEYNIEQDAKEAMEMLGKGYDAPYEIHLPAKTLRDNGDGLQETQSGVWVKITASFRDKHLRKLKGSKLGVWLCIALHINENNDCHPSIETICKETGYSNREVIDCIRELENGGYLTVARGKEKYNIYHVNFGAAYGKGNDPISEESSQVKFDAGNSELSSKKTRQSSLKEEPIKKNQTKKKGDILDGILDFHLSPKAIQDAIRDYFKLTPNWETKFNREFMQWAVGESIAPEQVKAAADLWRKDKRFNWAAPNLKGIQEHWIELTGTSSNRLFDQPVLSPAELERVREYARKELIGDA